MRDYAQQHPRYLEHIERFRGRPGQVQGRILATAERDGPATTIGLFRDPGQAGVMEADYLVRMLIGYPTVVIPETASKETKAAPLSSYSQGAGEGQGHVAMVVGPWNAAWLAEAENFPKSSHDDQVDAASGAFGWLVGQLRLGPIDCVSAGPSALAGALDGAHWGGGGGGATLTRHGWGSVGGLGAMTWPGSD